MFILKMIEPDFHFTFHFSNFQYLLSQDTGLSFAISVSGWPIFQIMVEVVVEQARKHRDQFGQRRRRSPVGSIRDQYGIGDELPSVRDQYTSRGSKQDQ